MTDINVLPVVKHQRRNHNPNPVHIDFDVLNYCKSWDQVPRRSYECYASRSCSIIFSIIWSCHLRKRIIFNSILINILYALALLINRYCYCITYTIKKDSASRIYIII